MLTSAVVPFLALLTTLSIIYCMLCIYAARRFFRHVAVRRKPARLPPVSILIPLCGVDFKALANYTSFCRQDYPQFQIVFGVQDPHDPSIIVVRQLMSLFPDNDLELVVSSASLGQNPKVSNLNNMLPRAKHECLVITDSDIRVGRDFLREIIAELSEQKVGLVTCPYRAAEVQGLPSQLESMGITGEFMPGVFVAHLIEGITFALGAAMATTRGTLQAIGGFQVISDYLADDYMLGNLIHKAGFQVRLSSCVIETMSTHRGFAGMIRHQMRWARGTRICRPMSYAGYVVTHALPLAILFVTAAGASPLSMLVFSVAAVARITMVWYVGTHLLRDAILRRSLWLLPVRDILSFFIWCSSFFGNTVEWRGKRFKIVKDGKLKPDKG